MRSSAARAYSLLFLLSGATGLVYELLWVRLLYQAFGSTVQSVTTVVAAYMGGLGLGAWLLGRRAGRVLPHRVRRHPGEPLGHRAGEPAHRCERAPPARSPGVRATP